MGLHLLPVFFTGDGEGVLAERVVNAESAEDLFRRLSISDKLYLSSRLYPTGGLTIAYEDEQWAPADPARRFADLDVFRKTLGVEGMPPKWACEAFACSDGVPVVFTWRGAWIEVDRPGFWREPIQVSRWAMREAFHIASETFGRALYHLRPHSLIADGDADGRNGVRSAHRNPASGL